MQMMDISTYLYVHLTRTFGHFVPNNLLLTYVIYSWQPVRGQSVQYYYSNRSSLCNSIHTYLTWLQGNVIVHLDLTGLTFYG